MKHVKHWQDYGNILLGAWLLCSPLLLGFQANLAALDNTIAVGVLLLATAFGAVLVPRVWEDWTELVLGAWLAMSPLFFEFGTQIGAVNALVCGLLVVTLSLWAVQDHEIAKGHGAPTTL